MKSCATAPPDPGARRRPCPPFLVGYSGNLEDALDIGALCEVIRATAIEVFEAVRAFVSPVMVPRSLALSLETRNIDPALSPKTGSIRDHL